MRKYTLFIITLLYPLFVIFLFRSQVLPYPQYVALVGFAIIAFINLFSAYKGPLGFKSALFIGAVLFILGSLLPITLMQIMALLSGASFSDQYLFGFPAQIWHHYSSHFYSLLILGSVIDWIRLRGSAH